MSYTPTNWVGNDTPLSAANMNKIENGVKEAHDQGDLVTLFLAAATNPHETSGTVGNEINLAQPMTDFKTIIVEMFAVGKCWKYIPTSRWVSGNIRIRDIGNAITPGSTILGFGDILLNRTSSSKLTIAAAGWISWTGNKDDSASRTETSAILYISAIFGVK